MMDISKSNLNSQLGKSDNLYLSMQESFAILRIMVLVLATLTWIIVEAAPAKYFNVMDYGAIGDGVIDDSVVIIPYSLANENLIC